MLPTVPLLSPPPPLGPAAAGAEVTAVTELNENTEGTDWDNGGSELVACRIHVGGLIDNLVELSEFVRAGSREHRTVRSSRSPVLKTSSQTREEGIGRDR